MSEQGRACTEMDVEEVDVLRIENDVSSTDVTLTTSALSIGVKRRIVDTELYYGAVRYGTKGTQTQGHVFIGKRGETIITTNYTLVKLVLNKEAVQNLTDGTHADEDRITDIIMTSLARLEWNADRILDKAMTSFRLTLKNDLMPRLLREVAELLSTEHEHHRVEQLARELLDQHLVRLFGVDVSSLVFVLEHCSVDDATMTLTSTQKQEELKAVLLTFLPKWVVDSPLATAEWTVAAYKLTAEDRARDFGFKDAREMFFDTASDQLKGSSSIGEALVPEPPTLRAEEDAASSHSESKSVAVEEVSHHLSLMDESDAVRMASMEDPKETRSYKSPSQEDQDLQRSPSLRQTIAGSVAESPSAGPLLAAETEMLTSVSAAEPQPASKGFLRLDDIDTDDIPKHEVDWRLVILGRTGNGKSSTANSIVGQELFPAQASFTSVTTECQLRTASRDGATFEILDTPGLFDTTMSTQDVSNMVLTAVSRMEDGPDALLYTIKIGGRYTDEEFEAYNLLKVLLDENITGYIIVVFTHGDMLNGREIEGMIQKPEKLVTVLRECGNRYTVFDNTADDKTPQVNQLLSKIQQLKQQNYGRRYRCPRYAENLDEIDLELELRLVKVEQQRLKGKTYIQTLQARLLQTEEQLEKDKQEFARQEKARHEAFKKREQAMRERMAHMTESLQKQQVEEEERQKRVGALKEEGKQSQLEMERLERQQAEEWRKRNEERQRCMEKLRADREEAERAARERQAAEMERLRTEVARNRRRKRNQCSLM